MFRMAVWFKKSLNTLNPLDLFGLHILEGAIIASFSPIMFLKQRHVHKSMLTNQTVSLANIILEINATAR